MSTPHFSSFYSPLLILLLLSFIVYQVDGTDEMLSARLHVNLKTLQSRDSCSPSIKVKFAGGVSSGYNWTSLRVVDRHGPCSPIAGQRKQLSQAKILELDRARVDDIYRGVSHSEPLAASATSISARSGAYLGSGNYVVTVGFGTPKKDQTIILDTGSGVSWIQCQPCVVSCREQEAPLFDPSLSSTYANISCASSFCNELGKPNCFGSNCIYHVRYGDGRVTTTGFYAQDTLTLSPNDRIPGFRFGCGENTTGHVSRTDGLLGLGRDKASIVSQTYPKYGGVFSYCLPLTSSSVGYLAFGSYPADNLQFTPMLSNTMFPTRYYFALTGISVDGQLLAVPPSIFTNGGTIIDSGTAITRLPATAYSALRSAFRRGMTAYQSVPGTRVLDTCYDFSGSGCQVTIPSVALHLGGGVTIDLEGAGILIGGSLTRVCLAFTGNRDDSSMSILGNTQQRGFNVLYDINRQVIGFGPGDCS